MQQHDAHLFPTPQGICLAGIVIAERKADGSFAISGHERKVHAALQAAYERPLSPQVLSCIKRGCDLFAKVSDKELLDAAHSYFPNPHAKPMLGTDFPLMAKGLMEFALTGLNDMPELAEGKARLQKMFSARAPETLLKSYGLPTWDEMIKDIGDDEDEEDDDSDSDSSTAGGDNGSGSNGDFDAQHPRWPAGSPDGAGGEFRPKDGNSGTGEYQVAQRTDVMTDVTPESTQPSVTVQTRTNITINNPDGSSENRVGGSASWRNNNASNIISGDFADNHGAIGDNHGFAVFPDEATGNAASAALLRTGSYSDLTIDEAIARRSPPNENDTEQVQQNVRDIGGFTGTETVGQLNEEQMNRLVNAIRTSEGYRAGTVTRTPTGGN